MSRIGIALALFAALPLSSAAMAQRVDFHATLDGKTEVPPKDTKGTGDALATLDRKTKTLTYTTVTYQGLTGPATTGHFHGPAAATGANAGVAVPFKVSAEPDHRHRHADGRADRRSDSGQMVCQRAYRREPGR